MRIALILAGDPRWSKEFDSFLSSINGNFSIDWFVYLWDNADTTGGRPDWEVVSKNWSPCNQQWAREKIESCLPNNHHLKSIDLSDRLSLTIPDIHNKAGETSIERMYSMYYSLYRADQLRKTYQDQNFFTYDIVIRTRPDLGLTGIIDLEKAINYIRANPNAILTPNSEIHGYGVKMNDMVAIGNDRSISVYCSMFESLIHYNRQGVIFHPETMLAYHCAVNNLNVVPIDEWGKIILRQLGRVENNGYKSDFGRWA